MSALIYPTTNFSATETLKIVRGDGIYIYDDTGKPYLEAMSGLWCASLGFNHRELIEAATQQMETLSYAHMFGGRTHDVGMELADKLAAMLPVADARIFFGCSGSDANDTQIKLLRYYFAAQGKPEKRKIIARERSYHGVTIAAACLTGLPINHTHFDLPMEALGILRTDAPHYLHGALPGESETEFTDRLVANLETLILREGPETIAAFIAEPITGASGVIVPPAGYSTKVAALLRKYDILLWSDEVITGFGRTGSDFGSTSMGFTPDMMSLAKQLSSSYVPISAAVIRGDMYEAMVDPCRDLGVFGHGYTYTAHPLACAVGLKTLEIYERDSIFALAAQTGEYLQQSLATFAENPLVCEVRGQGMLAAIELDATRINGCQHTTAQLASYAGQACQRHGLISRVVAASSLALCPPLITTPAQVDEIISLMGLALEETLVYARQ